MTNKINPNDFIVWLTTQHNSRNLLYSEKVARHYAGYLRTTPPKLNIMLSADDREVFACATTAEFDELRKYFIAAPNYTAVNKNGHQSFSSGMNAYRRYLESLEQQGENIKRKQQLKIEKVATTSTGKADTAVRRVDFDHTELCADCNPVTCTVRGERILVGTWRDLLMTLVTKFTGEKPDKINELYSRPLLAGSSRPFFLKDKPSGAARQTTNGYWVYVNLNIPDLVNLIGKLCQYCGMNLKDVEIIYTPKSSGRSSDMAFEFNDGLDNKYHELLNTNSTINTAPSVSDAVIAVLNKNYASGFRFDTTYINLLSSASGVEVDGRMQSALKRIMFRRCDDIYFLLDIVADAAARKDIIDFSDTYLQEYGCFEISEFYKRYEDKVNSNCIRNADDFENFYEQIGKSGVRCVQAPYIGNRIARYSNGSVWSIFKGVAEKIISVITEEYYGSCNEDDLHAKFCAFSTDLLGKIIKQCAADELIRVEINGSVCYQTFDALGLPENFSNVLAEALERLSDIGLAPTQDILHTTLSLTLGVNFRDEYNLPDWDTYRRLIAAFYKAEPRREWESNIFREVTR